MQKMRVKKLQISKIKAIKQSKKILSLTLALAITVTSIPAISLFKGLINVDAAVSFTTTKLGVAVMCSDLLKDNYEKNMYDALIKAPTAGEDSKNGSVFNNVRITGLNYNDKHSTNGRTYDIDLQSDQYAALRTLAKNGQIQQSITAYAKNHNHRSTKRHWNKIKQYCKIILGYPTSSTNESFYLGKCYETNNNGDHDPVGGNGDWTKLDGWKSRLAIYLTAKKGCDGCSGAYIEKVGLAFKDITAPKITSVNVYKKTENGRTSADFFREDDTLQFEVKFSEYIRLADNNGNGDKSKKTSLAFDLGSSTTKSITTEKASLVSISGDTAIFEYKVKKEITVGTEKRATNYYVSQISPLTKQKDLIQKLDDTKDKNIQQPFRRVLVDANGATISENSATFKKIKNVLNNANVSINRINYTTSAITDIAGNPLDSNSFGTNKPTVKNVVLDTVSPTVDSVFITSSQDDARTANDFEGNYLKNGTVLKVNVKFNERLNTINTSDYSNIVATLNIKNSSGNNIKISPTKISYGDTTDIEFANVTINNGMYMEKDANLKYSSKSDYKITVKSISFDSYIKDRSLNVATVASDLRNVTPRAYYIDNEAPRIKIVDANNGINEQINESKYYPLTRFGNEGEVYQIVLNTLDFDSRLNSSDCAYTSGVMGGKANLSVDLQADLKLESNRKEFEFALSDKPIEAKALKNHWKGANSNNLLYITNVEKINTDIDLAKKESNLYLYIKFIDNIDYAEVKSGIKVRMTAKDVNGNAKTTTAKFSYTPADKVIPTILDSSIKLINNSDNSASQTVSVNISDNGGIDVDTIKYAWVMDGQAVPSDNEFSILGSEYVVDRTVQNGKVILCTANISTKKIEANQKYKAYLYVIISDKSGNILREEKLETAEIDTNIPAMQMEVTKDKNAEKSSILINGPFTSSSNELKYFVAIEDPQNKGFYFVRTDKGKSNTVSKKDYDILNSKLLSFDDNYDTDEISKWIYCKITKDGAAYTLEKQTELTPYSAIIYRKRLLAIGSNHYYGNLKVIAGTGFVTSSFETVSETKELFYANKGQLIEDTMIMLPDEYALSSNRDVKKEGYSLHNKYTHIVNYDVSGMYGRQFYRNSVNDYNPEKYGPEYLTTLAGAEFGITITNGRTNDFVTDDIDYESDYTYIKLKNIDTNEYAYKWELGKTAKQSITIPEDLQLENGHYIIEVSIANYINDAESNVIIFCYDDIYIYNYDNDMTEAFGVDQITTNISFTASDEYDNPHIPPYYNFKNIGSYDFNRTFTDSYNPDYAGKALEAYTTDTIYLGNCLTDTYEAGNTINYNRTVKLSFNEMAVKDSANYWVKIWTGDFDNSSKAHWYILKDFDQNNNTLFFNAKFVDAKAVCSVNNAAEFYELNRHSDIYEIPVFEGQNTISYQIINRGGVKSSVHEIEVYYCTEAPVVKIDVDNEEVIATSVSARVSQLSSNLVTKEVNLYESNFDGKEDKVNPISEREFTYKSNKRHLYYAVDGYRNLGFTQFHVMNVDVSSPMAYFETINPANYISYGDAEGDGYLENANLEAIIIDDKPLMNADIQITVDDNEPFIVRASESYEYDDGSVNGYVYEEALADTGMSDVQLFYGPNLVLDSNGSYYDGNNSLKIYMVLNDDIDKNKGDKEKIRHEVKITVMDTVGKTLEKPLTATGGDIYGLNNVPKINSIMCEPEGQFIELGFSGRVRVTKINGEDVPEKLYSIMKYMDRFTLSTGNQMLGQFEGDMALDIKLKDYFGICKDGKYSIEYLDTFNNSYVSEFTVRDFFGNYSADINYSTSAKTNQDVVATITGTDKNAELTLTEPELTSENYTITWNKDKSKATIVFNQNDSVSFDLKVKGAVEDKVVQYNVTVGNIDKKAPDDVEVTWMFNETSQVLKGQKITADQLISTTTSNSIDVYISSPTEDICGINGKELKHTFIYSNNMERTYTFEYSDECGNVGEPLVITLPEELVMTEYEPPIPAEGEEVVDTEAPDVMADIYAIYDSIAEYKTSWSPETDSFEETIEGIGYTGGYKIKYSLLDKSKTKLIVLEGKNASTTGITYSSSSDRIDGVIVSEVDTSIIITKPCELTVLAIDEAGNKAVHSFAVTEIDTENPTVSVKKVGKSFTLMRIHFYTDDNTDSKNALGTITPVTKGLGMGMDEDGYYYYMEVSDNGTYNATFKDKSGNRTTLSTKVTEIDNQAPSINVSSWTPCYNNNGTPIETIPPNLPTNSSVIVSLDFNKTVSELKVYYKQNEDWIEDKNQFSVASIELGGRKGKVEFKDSVPGIVKIVAKSPNGMTNEITDIDLVGIIDKKMPDVSYNQILENNMVKVTFKSDEKVFVTGCDYDTTYGGNTNIPLTIKKNGTYNLTFADMAGNVVTRSITVDNIDEIAPEVFALGIPEDYVTPNNCIIKVTMSEKGTITFQGKDYKVNAPVDKNQDGKLVGDELDWITLPISCNGNFQVRATDEAGLVSYKLLEVKYVDDIAPYIQFNNPVLSVAQGTTVDELKEMLLDDTSYNFWDDIDTAPHLSLEGMLNEKQLNTQGVYEVKYILKDYAGNKRTVYRYVKVISSANLIIKANNELMMACDTTILNDDNVTLTLEKSKRKGESFKIYYKQGIRKAGSMKNASVSKDGKLSNLNSGFYTLYIVTQNKESYLTYIYIRK